MEIKTLIQTAIDALPNSYVPYSRFHVAAALLCKDGTVYTGNNIEKRPTLRQSARSGARFSRQLVTENGSLKPS